MLRVVNVAGMNKPAQRAGVCYVGRRFAGWPQALQHNPYRTVTAFVVLLEQLDAKGLLDAYLDDLWERCERGAKPLGCWCINATHGDGQPVVCHAQVLAARLAERCPSSPEATDGLADAPATGAGDV